eukprot:5408125-Amphidinium_carterae.1
MALGSELAEVELPHSKLQLCCLCTLLDSGCLVRGAPLSSLVLVKTAFWINLMSVVDVCARFDDLPPEEKRLVKQRPSLRILNDIAEPE